MNLEVFGKILACGLLMAVAAGTAFGGVDREFAAQTWVDYFETMSVPEPFEVLTGDALAKRHEMLRSSLLRDIALDPMPERVPLDVHRAEAIDHPWCTISKLAYQLWPGVYARGVLYMPKESPEKPAPAVLAPHGHWPNGYAYIDVQKRCMMLAHLGYVVLCPEQTHLEDLPIGFSNQTLMVWSNMRALDLLQSLEQVDPSRIGVCGMSGGGLQTQMILAMDPTRIDAAMVGGLTCDTREIGFPHAAHCRCNHFPNYMRYTDLPEISSMGYPAAVGYLTMRDWTEHFRYTNFPTIQSMYGANGYPDRAYCGFWPTAHIYDRNKREVTYWWMEQYVRGNAAAEIPVEPDEIQTIWPDTVLANLPVEVPGEKGLDHAARLYRERFGYTAPRLQSNEEWAQYAAAMAELLPELLGMDEVLPAENQYGYHEEATAMAGGVSVSRGTVASEGPFVLPVEIVAPGPTGTGAEVVVLLQPSGVPATASEALPVHVTALVHEGKVVVLADVRYTGVYELGGLKDLVRPSLRSFKPAYDLAEGTTPEEKDTNVRWAAERNSIVWGRPISGQIVSDIAAVIDAVEARLAPSSITVATRDVGYLAVAALFAATLDARITGLDIDVNHSTFAEYTPWCDAKDKLTVVPFILRHGDIAQWSAVVADRMVVLRRLSGEAEAAWLEEAFAAGNSGGLSLVN
jgi:poly(3-hydroxybutyrate) depolymerase